MYRVQLHEENTNHVLQYEECMEDLWQDRMPRRRCSHEDARSEQRNLYEGSPNIRPWEITNRANSDSMQPTSSNNTPLWGSQTLHTEGEDTNEARPYPAETGLGYQTPELYPSHISQYEDSIEDIWKDRMPRLQSSTHDDATPVSVGHKPKNVILFGETGVGKSSVINLMAGKDIAQISPNLEGCTLGTTEYRFRLSEEVSCRIYDTVGLEEPEIGVNMFMGAIEKAYNLVQSLHANGGIDLLLFCIRGGRMTVAMQRNHHLFFDVLCGERVPLAIVVTNLEQEHNMEDWWINNEATFLRYGIRAVAHACVTAVPASLTEFAQKRAESQEALRNMLLRVLRTPNPYVRDTEGWFVDVMRMLRSALGRNTSAPKKKELAKRLERSCALSQSDAETLAQKFITPENS